MEIPEKPISSQIRIKRRQFLQGFVLLGGASVVAACTNRPASTPPGPFQTATPYRVLSSPFPAQGRTGVPEGSISLDEFLALSSALTGVDNLDPGLGMIYLQALESGARSGSSLAEVYSAASSGSSLPQDVETLSQSGFFDQANTAETADTIINMWYSGVYAVDGEDVVATYTDALAWKVLNFTKPPTTCGRFGFWSEAPRVEISPQMQYTPVPTQAQGS